MNNNNNKPLCFLKGKLSVAARGYWFTAGGEKGSFGYYPHLKKEENGKLHPVYPDTQIHGDLKMAALWLCRLDDSYKETFVHRIFGYDSRDRQDGANITNVETKPSMIFFTDLELSDTSGWEDEYFQVKTRISIDEQNRTVEEHMLVSLEMAYMEDQNLEADFYIYDRLTPEEAEKAKKMVEDAAHLAGGFGAFRSRGCGRGKVTVDWRENLVTLWKPDSNLPDYSVPALPGDGKCAFICALTALAHFRSKQLDPASAQLLTSAPKVTSDQLRAWFVNTYAFVDGDWPSAEVMAKITFPDLYPAPADGTDIEPAYPPARSTVRNEEGHIRDVTNTAEDSGDGGRDDSDEFFSTKTKPLPDGYFVTDQTPARVIKARKEKRMRNSTLRNFSTLEDGGLFVQEFVEKGTTFAGVVRFENADAELAGKVRFIFNHFKPLINGCPFDVSLGEPPEDTGADGDYLLVTGPIPYSTSDSEKLVNDRKQSYCEIIAPDGKERVVLKEANQVTLTSLRSYNTTLKRPRRRRIAVDPGSVIRTAPAGDYAHQDKLLAWKGFGRDMPPEEPEVLQKEEKKEMYPLLDCSERQSCKELAKKLDKANFTRSQMGLVREFMNLKRDSKDIGSEINQRIKKYDKKKEGYEVHKELYDKMGQHLDNRSKLNAFIDCMLDELYLQWWRKRQ